jgi:hypothetical protein
MTKLNWIKCSGDNWCSLANLNLEHEHFNSLAGVYIIWHSGNESIQAATVRVGQGEIKNRLNEHKLNPDIMKYNNPYKLLVSWASVSADQRDGIERYLANVLNPLVGDRFPEAAPVPVNLPW